MKRKLVVAVALFSTLSFVWAGTLTVSSVSFSDSLGNPVEKDYKVDSYRIVGKNMPNSSTIAGQFAKDFSEIPMTLDNLANSDNWEIKVYAYDTNGKLVGQSELERISITDNTSLDIDIVVDVPTLYLSEPVIAINGQYENISEYYDSASYRLQFNSFNGDEEITEIITSFPYINTALTPGRWNVTIEALDSSGNTIASSGNLYFKLSSTGTVRATIALDVQNKQLSFTKTGIEEANGYNYLIDSDAFSLKATVSPLKKTDSVSYKWYVSEDGKWKEIEDISSDTLTYDDIKDSVKDQDTFSILCTPILNGKSYHGYYITISSVPELIPTLYVTGSKPISLTDNKTSFDIVSSSGKAGFALDLPTFYLGQGIKVYYTTDGSDPNENSSLLVIGDVVKLDSGDNTLKLLLVDGSGEEYTYTIEMNVKEKVQSPSISISNRDFGRDFYATLSTRTEGATIYYTVDGTDPNENSLKYTEPFKVYSLGDKEGVHIKAIAIKEGAENSSITEIKGF